MRAVRCPDFEVLVSLGFIADLAESLLQGSDNVSRKGGCLLRIPVALNGPVSAVEGAPRPAKRTEAEGSDQPWEEWQLNVERRHIAASAE